jgi:hypothetical protein
VKPRGVQPGRQSPPSRHVLLFENRGWLSHSPAPAVISACVVCSPAMRNLSTLTTRVEITIRSTSSRPNSYRRQRCGSPRGSPLGREVLERSNISTRWVLFQGGLRVRIRLPPAASRAQGLNTSVFPNPQSGRGYKLLVQAQTSGRDGCARRREGRIGRRAIGKEARGRQKRRCAHLKVFKAGWRATGRDGWMACARGSAGFDF